MFSFMFQQINPLSTVPKMIKSANPEERHCENCGKVLFGRTDKRFCNDTCRNTFNREKHLREKIKENENLPEILRIIKRNYQILKSKGPGPMDKYFQLIIPVEELVNEGFNFKYFTSIYFFGNELWRFCFERGWRKDDEYFYIQDRPEQVG